NSNSGLLVAGRARRYDRSDARRQTYQKRSQPTRNAHNKEKTQMFPLIEAFNEGLHTRRCLGDGIRHRSLNPRRRTSDHSNTRPRLESRKVSFKLSGRPGAVLLLLAMVVSLGIPRPTSAQVLYGSVTGNVTDPNGAVVTDAKVEALNIATSISK